MKKPFLNPEDTLVITDFDGTLLKKVVEGQRVPSLISELMKPRFLGEEGVVYTNKLVAEYSPKEQDKSLAPETKAALMQEWWEKTYEALKRFGVTRQMIEEICHSPFIHLREGVEKWFNYLARYHTPIIIYSASGIGYDSIEYILRKHHLLTPNVNVCSNDIVFDEEGAFIGVNPPIIHSANKVGTTLMQLGYVSNPPKQSACLLIGDNQDDIRMFEGLTFSNRHSVIFSEDQQIQGLQGFDQVLPIESSFEPIRKLFIA